MMYTDLINQCVPREEDRLTVFDPSGPYLATKKVGKNNPMADEIRSDNAIRQEWNQVVDQVLIAGGTVDEVTEFKQEEVVRKITSSIREHGEAPGLLASVIRKAIAVLKEFLMILMEQADAVHEPEMVQPEKTTSYEKKERKGKRPDSSKEEHNFRVIEGVYQKLSKANRKLFALQKQKGTVQIALDQIPGGILHRKERKALQERIDGLERQMRQTQDQLSLIPKQHGYESVRAVKKAHNDAKAALDEVRIKQAEWDGVVYPEAQKPQNQAQKVSVLKQLAAKQIEVSNQEHRSGKTKEVEL